MKTIEIAWSEYWAAYVANNPDADGSDYADEKQAFYDDFLGGF